MAGIPQKRCGVLLWVSYPEAHDIGLPLMGDRPVKTLPSFSITVVAINMHSSDLLRGGAHLMAAPAAELRILLCGHFPLLLPANE